MCIQLMRSQNFVQTPDVSSGQMVNVDGLASMTSSQGCLESGGMVNHNSLRAINSAHGDGCTDSWYPDGRLGINGFIPHI